MANLIPFQCPACGAKRQVPQSLSGRRANCPECDAMVEVLPLEALAVPLEIDPLAETIPVPLPGSTHGASQPKLPPIPPPPPPGYEDRSSVEDFDPYYRWLAIPKSEQPANHYRLLGLPLFENDPDVILNSSERQMAHVKAQAGGKNLVICQRLLSELSLARICLLDAHKKADYDAQLRVKKKPPSSGERKSGGKPDKSVKEKSKPERSPKAASQHRPTSRFEQGPSVVAFKEATADAETQVESLAVVAEPEAPPVHSRWKGAPEPAPVETVPQAVEESEEPEEEVKFKRRPVEGEMDMTPMIDVTFLLLIFFICTASFSLIMTKEIPAPKEDEPSTNATTIEEFEDDPDYVTVRIDAYNTFRVITPDIDEEAPSYQELVVKLRAARQGGSDGKIPTSLMVIVNSQAKHKSQVMALDAGTEVGMEKMQLMTVETDDE